MIDSIKNRLGNGNGNGDLILLESQLSGHPSSGKSYLAAKPVSTIRAYGDKIIRTEKDQEEIFSMNPWEALKTYQSNKNNWLFGYIGYDMKNHIEKIHSQNPALIHAPDYFFMEPSVLVQVEKDEVSMLKGDLPFTEFLEKKIEGKVERLHQDLTKSNYIRKIGWIKEQIKEGDFYELNYSFPLRGEFYGDPYWLYTKMREINPVPFGGYIRFDDISVCCASPERFLKKTGNRIVSEPIKGTAPRPDHPETDRLFKETLLNEKNRAENLMIVDLVRHDFSKMAVPGSVKVSKLFDIQSFGTVHQLISTVVAETKKEVHPVDVIRACFPMGSMTGAPKIKVMQAIEKIENYRRGIYSGAIGYFKPGGDFDFNVVIRSAMVQKQKLIYPVGGAITSDSDPEEEWEETFIKSRVLRKVIDAALVKE